MNAEGDSPSAFSRGWSVSVTPGMPVLKEKRLEDANVVAKVADIRVLLASCGVARYRGLRFAPPPATSHSLRSGLRPFRSRCGGDFTTDFHESGTDFHIVVFICALFCVIGVY